MASTLPEEELVEQLRADLIGLREATRAALTRLYDAEKKFAKIEAQRARRADLRVVVPYRPRSTGVA